MNSIYQEWHNTTSNNMVERMHSGLHNEESLSFLEKNLDEKLGEGIKYLMNHHVEPP